MDTNKIFTSAWPVLAAAVVASALFTSGVAAKDVTVAIQVSIQGLDLSQPAGAKELYARLQKAAWVVCTRGDRVGLAPSPNPVACAEKALGAAIRSANQPLLTQAYLGGHTLQQAAAYGIDVHTLIAAK